MCAHTHTVLAVIDLENNFLAKPSEVSSLLLQKKKSFSRPSASQTNSKLTSKLARIILTSALSTGLQEQNSPSGLGSYSLKKHLEIYIYTCKCERVKKKMENLKKLEKKKEKEKK